MCMYIHLTKVQAANFYILIGNILQYSTVHHTTHIVYEYNRILILVL